MVVGAAVHSPSAELRPVGAVGAADFGASMARSGDWLAVGAPQNQVGTVTSGSVFVFLNVLGEWVQMQRLDPSPAGVHHFGVDVAMEGDLLVVGASWDTVKGVGAGAVYIYRQGPAGFTLEQKVFSPTPASQDYFGTYVATDGTRVFATSWDQPSGHGAVHVFTKGTGTWGATQKLTPATGEWFEGELAVDGNVLALGSMYDDSVKQKAGAVYVFNWNGASWQRVQKLAPNDLARFDNFGFGLAVSGNILVAGAPGQDGPGASNRGAAYAYKLNPSGQWGLDQKLLPPGLLAGDRFGFAGATDGSVILFSAPWRAAGELMLFRNLGTGWVTTDNYASGTLGEEVGTSVLLGSEILAGAPKDPVGGVVERYA